MQKTHKILDGKSIASTIRQTIADKVNALKQQGKRVPGLAVILVGQDPASEVYVRSKRRACEEVGFISIAHDLPISISQQQLFDLITKLNNDPTVDGILLQLPLPSSIETN